MIRREALAVLGAGVIARPSISLAQSCSQIGFFVGPLQTVNITADGQKRRLSAPFSYIDRCGISWDVPKHTPLDGASIPTLFWAVVGRPWEGKYVEASVIHDYQCYRRIESSDKVHRLFYEGMLVSGVAKLKAKTMYLAVKLGGPKWDWATVDANRQAAGLPPYPTPSVLPPPPAPFPPTPAPPGMPPPVESESGFGLAFHVPASPGPITPDKLAELVEFTEENDLSLSAIDALAESNSP